MNMEAYALFNTNNDINNSLDAMVDSATTHSAVASVLPQPPQPPQPEPAIASSAVVAPRVVVTKHNIPIPASERPATNFRVTRLDAGIRPMKNPPDSVLRKSIKPHSTARTTGVPVQANIARSSMENVIPRNYAPPAPMNK